MFYQWYYPKAENIQPEQEDYISDWFYNFESAVFSNDYHNYLGKRYTDYINLNSFVDFLIINELSKNSDGYKLSSYLHKDRDDNNGGLLNAGPIWDFDQTYGVSEVCSNYDPLHSCIKAAKLIKIMMIRVSNYTKTSISSC